MVDNRFSKNDSSSPREYSTTQIGSPIWLWIGRGAFVVLLIAAIVFTGQMTLVAISYHQGIAAGQLTDMGVLAGVYVWIQVFARLIVHTIFIMTAIFLFWKRSHDRIGLLSATTMVTIGTAGIGFYLAVPDMTSLLAERNLLWGYYLLSPLGWALAGLFWIVFPDGRFIPRWTRYLVIIDVFQAIVWAMPSDSPLYPFNWSPLLLSAVVLPFFGLSLYAQAYRYRKVSTPTQRQQTKWWVYAVGLAFSIYSIGLLIPTILPDIFPFGSAAQQVVFLVGQVSLVLVPIVLLFALMRYRLWDVDLVINRTLVYGAAGVVAAVIFVGLLSGLELATGQTQPVLVLIISAVLSILLYAPMRNRLQHVVDRNIYQLRFDLNELNQVHKGPTIKNPGALTGRKLGVYEVHDLIGKGGMGEVYRAVGNGEIVAIKTLLSDLEANDELLQRFQREAQAGMTLQHPNIAHVRSIDNQAGLIYMVMDYLDGQDLSAVLKGKAKLDSGNTIRIVTALVEALAAAHAEGFIHRDLKPSNIMLVPQESSERVVLMDFGLTKMQGAKSLTNAGTIGTIDYMAPEQIINAREVDHRADIYSLGVVMYEMLVGERPFTGNLAQVLFAHVQQPAPDPRDMDKTVPRELAKTILKALEKNPDRRFQSVSELGEALRTTAADQDDPQIIQYQPRDSGATFNGTSMPTIIDLS